MWNNLLTNRIETCIILYNIKYIEEAVFLINNAHIGYKIKLNL